MGTRIDDLMEPVRDTAKKMAAKCGTLKLALSAGILALSESTPEQRELYLEKLNSEREFKPENKETLRQITRIITKKGTKINFGSESDKEMFERFVKLHGGPDFEDGFNDFQNADQDTQAHHKGKKPKRNSAG